MICNRLDFEKTKILTNYAQNYFWSMQTTHVTWRWFTIESGE